MKKILLFGLPGSGKSYLAEPLAKELDGVWINADQVREEYDDWDFSPEGRMRQAMRMKFLSEGVVYALVSMPLQILFVRLKKLDRSFNQTTQFGWILSRKGVLKILIRYLKSLSK